MTHPLWGECGEHVDVGKTWGKCWYITFPYFPSKWLIHCGENVGDMLMWGKPGENVDTNIFLILLINDSSIVGRMWELCWCGKNLGEKIDTYLFLILILNDSSIVGRMWGICWCGENLGKMLVLTFVAREGKLQLMMRIALGQCVRNSTEMVIW